MCGISGIYSYAVDAPPVSSSELLATRDAMAVRGPDGHGIWIAPDGRLGLAHRRLSILDLSNAGAQPMSSQDLRFWITFNGEIYNFRELRKRLELRGYGFRSASDTEVLLCLYREYGAGIVHHLRGMFAFGIWDAHERSLFLARDPFGIKPLYYADAGGVFRFASQVKALVAGGGIDTSPDPAGHAGFFLWGSVPEPFTTYRAIRALPAGCSLLVTGNGPTNPTPYFSVRAELLKAEQDSPSMSSSGVQDLVSEALYDSVKHHLISDVPVGVFLSAGIDSSVIAAIASELVPGQLRTVTLGFREYFGTELDETVWAGRTASAYGAEHQSRWIDKADFCDQVEAILSAMDQPSTDGVNTWLVSRAASQAGLKVALSGLGGDELFGGYPSFRDVPRMERLPALGVHFPRLSRWARRVAAAALGRRMSPKYAGLLELAGRTSGAYQLRRGLYMPWELKRLMDPNMAESGLRELATLPSLEERVRGIKRPRLRVMCLEASWYMRNQLLRDCDWAGMAHSLEIRVPLVDVQFFRTIACALACEHPPTKTVLARTPRKALPAAILSRAKTGFAVPVADWIAGGTLRHARGLRGWARRVNRGHGVGYRIAAFLSDAFGGRGGIALYSRDLLFAVAAHPNCREVVALPRLMPDSPGALPHGLTYRTYASNGKLRYLLEYLRLLFDGRGIDAIVCGHINLLPLAAAARWWSGAPLLLCIYGIEAWKRPASTFVMTALRRVDQFLSISEITRNRFLDWAQLRSDGHVVPNAIHLDWYSPGPKDPRLLARYGLEGRTVLMTVGRLAPSERYKGFDEVIEALPSLIRRRPDLAYLIVGDGADRRRLELKARELGLEQVVKFAGHVDEAEKPAHYQLADAYVMPSHGEGFGFVLLEALASGIPVLASKLDGSREALRNGKLGIIVDPRDREEVERGILSTLEQQRGKVPDGLAYFSYPNFERRSHLVFDQLFHGRTSAPATRLRSDECNIVRDDAGA